MKQTRHGIEIKTADRFAALKAVATHLGVFEKNNAQRSGGETLGDFLRRCINENRLAPDPDRGGDDDDDD